jgi:hypothetical protein
MPTNLPKRRAESRKPPTFFLILMVLATVMLASASVLYSALYIDHVAPQDDPCMSVSTVIPP